MVIPLALLFGALGYLYYKSKDEISLSDDSKLLKNKDDDDYQDLGDLFI